MEVNFKVFFKGSMLNIFMNHYIEVSRMTICDVDLLISTLSYDSAGFISYF